MIRNNINDKNKISLRGSIKGKRNMVFIMRLSKRKMRIKIRKCMKFNKKIRLLLIIKVIIKYMMRLRIE